MKNLAKALLILLPIATVIIYLLINKGNLSLTTLSIPLFYADSKSLLLGIGLIIAAFALRNSDGQKEYYRRRPEK